MATRDTAFPAGTPCWVDLTVKNFDEAAKFYSSLFGWSVTGSPEMGGYAVATLNGRAVAGIAPQMDPNMPLPGWITYLATDDLDASTEKVEEAGGALVMKPMDVMDEGRFALATDPAGALFGLWQARKHTGFTVFNEPGADCWNENMSTDWDRNKAFYQALFGYTYGDLSSDEMHYATFDLDGRPAGGIGQIPSGQSAWKTYFHSASTDKTVAKVKELGGAVVDPPRDTPFGRMAAVTDNQGFGFSVIQDPPEQS